MESFNLLSHLNLIHWGLLALFGVAAIFMLFKAGSIVQAYNMPMDRRHKQQKSVQAGVYGAGDWLLCILAIFTVLWANVGLVAAVYMSLILGGCTLPVMFIISVVRVFIQFSWMDKIKETRLESLNAN